MLTKPVKVFKNGASQAVRLPAEFRFNTEVIFATFDEATGNVLLSANPSENIWADFFADKPNLDTEGTSYMLKRPMNTITKEKAIF